MGASIAIWASAACIALHQERASPYRLGKMVRRDRQHVLDRELLAADAGELGVEAAIALHEEPEQAGHRRHRAVARKQPVEAGVPDLVDEHLDDPLLQRVAQLGLIAEDPTGGLEQPGEQYEA